MLLSKQQILEAADLPRETVEVPEWGGSVIVQGLSAAESRELFNDAGNKDSFAVRLLVASLVDEDGTRLFSYEDISALAAKSSQVLARVVKVANRINLFDVGDATKNSAPSADASSE